MEIKVVVLNYRTPDLCVQMLASLVPVVRNQQSTGVCLVDGGSNDGSAYQLRRTLANRNWEKDIEFVDISENRGFSAGNNWPISQLIFHQSRFDSVWLLNPDTILTESALIELESVLLLEDNWSIVGSRLEDPDGSTQYAARRFPNVFNELDSTARFGPISRLLRRWCIVMPESDEPHECDWLPGASLMIRREVFEKIGLLDEGFFMYFEEVDFCKRAKDAGFKVGYVPQSRVVHLVGQASGVTSSGGIIKKRRPTYWFDSRSRYFLRHHGRLGLLAANMAWLLGQFIYHTTRMLRGRPNEDPPYLVRDFVQHMFRLSTWKRPGPPIFPELRTGSSAAQPMTP